jgi:hypothetical protein
MCGITFDGHIACWNPDDGWWPLQVPTLLEEVTTK